MNSTFTDRPCADGIREDANERQHGTLRNMSVSEVVYMSNCVVLEGCGLATKTQPVTFEVTMTRNAPSQDPNHHCQRRHALAEPNRHGVRVSAWQAAECLNLRSTATWFLNGGISAVFILHFSQCQTTPRANTNATASVPRNWRRMKKKRTPVQFYPFFHFFIFSFFNFFYYFFVFFRVFFVFLLFLPLSRPLSPAPPKTSLFPTEILIFRHDSG